MNTHLPDEPSVYPYSAQRSLGARSALVFAPHPDDEVLGCGGLIAAWLDAGVPVHVVVVSDGGQGGDPATREQESTDAARALVGTAPGRLKLEFWRLPDRAIIADTALIHRMQRAIEDTAADCVLAPSLYEVHPDHRGVAMATALAFANVYGDKSAAQLAFYEIGQPLPANALVDITPVLSRKQAAIACFGSQLVVQPYGEQMLALNRYRSYTLGLAVSHAEAYQVLRAAALRDGLGAVLQAHAGAVAWRLGLIP